MKYDCVIWDWNGTLLDDVSASLRSVNDMLERRGMAPIDYPRYRACIGVPIRRFYEQVFDLSREDYAALLQEYNEGYVHYVNLDCGIAAGGRALLEQIQATGARQIIVSSCEKNQLEAAVKRYGVEQYFDAVLGADNFLADSKVERAVRYLADTYPGTLPRLIAVGDLVHDKDLARAVGADCVLIQSGHEDGARLRESGALLARDVADAARYILK